jgi:hypothetical protein
MRLGSPQLLHRGETAQFVSTQKIVESRPKSVFALDGKRLRQLPPHTVAAKVVKKWIERAERIAGNASIQEMLIFPPVARGLTLRINPSEHKAQILATSLRMPSNWRRVPISY